MIFSHPCFALLILLESLSVFYLLRKWIHINPTDTHSLTIDGLRGFLAFGVFLHHAYIWFYFLKTGSWVKPESRLFTHFGQSAVALFFMITGFLYFSKVLNSKERSVDWLRLYISRCLRILPLYLFVMLVGVLLMALMRHGIGLLPVAFPWDQRDLLELLTAGVTWTLAYEWNFYLALPLMAMFSVRVPFRWLIFSLAMLLLRKVTKTFDVYAFAFLGGIVAAYLAKVRPWVHFARTGWGSAVALTGLAVVVSYFDTAYAPLPLVLLTVSFALIANGADFWTLLAAELPRAFGELTYSIYLLHGPLLFIAFHVVIGFDRVAQLQPFQYWCVIALLTPVLLILSTVTYRKLETPLMQQTSVWTNQLRRFALGHRTRP
jgi:peptidoglycan/LPS O-acetylase OafA/YrhL